MTAQPPTLDVVAAYTAALAAGDAERMQALRAPGYVLDLAHRDAFHGALLDDERARTFWPSWFAGFPDLDFQVMRTIAAEDLVVIQWVFRGANSGPLIPPVFETRRDPTGRTICFRGSTFYDVREGLIWRETIYFDLNTLLVELGIIL